METKPVRILVIPVQEIKFYPSSHLFVDVCRGVLGDSGRQREIKLKITGCEN